MPKIFLLFFLLSSVVLFSQDQVNDTILVIDQMDEDIIIRANRSTERTPIATDNISNQEIRNLNFAKDVPQLLERIPSVTWSSDAGNAVGYTSLRMRGSDPTRINVSINGVPYNDSESQSVFWVNIPDLLSSARQIDVQRGLGTSTNGVGAFGGSVSIDLKNPEQERSVKYEGGYGSFNTLKNTVLFESGDIGKLRFHGRLSGIQSDGYIDRASSDLKSYLANAQWRLRKGIVQMIAYGGHEITYQAWNGVSESDLTNNRTKNTAGTYFGTFEEPYENEVDNYRQHHLLTSYQVQWNSNWSSRVTGHYTYGKGFFENLLGFQSLESYSIVQPESIANIVQRRWLDNDFYGLVANSIYEKNDVRITLGQSISKYQGLHFGEVIQVNDAPFEQENPFYDATGDKLEIQAFAKTEFDLTPRLGMFLDAQLRYIKHDLKGEEFGNIPVDEELTYNFFNPKLGLTYDMDAFKAYGFFGIGNKEPTREDIISRYNATNVPRSETLYNTELGGSYSLNNWSLGLNFYNMSYQNQLVLTGRLNEVGAALRENVENSYRRGIEIEGTYQNKKVSFTANASVQKSNIEKFTEYIYTYNAEDFSLIEELTEQVEYENTRIALSPDFTSFFEAKYHVTEKLDLRISYNAVGRQYLDNTKNMTRSIDPYQYFNAFVDIDLGMNKVNSSLQFGVFNLLNSTYETGGYTFSDRFLSRNGDVETLSDVNYNNFYYPQATRHFMILWKIGI